MKFLVLQGSPRKQGNTQFLVSNFSDEIKKQGHEIETIFLYDKEIKGCVACRSCQKDWTKLGCQFNDDAEEIFEKVLDSDVMVLATPMYAFFCTPPMKAFIDRLVYVMCKYYGDEKGPSLCEGKKVAIISTAGYRPEKGCDLFEEAIKRYCKHCKLDYISMYAERDYGYKTEFKDDTKAANARAYALNLINNNKASI